MRVHQDEPRDIPIHRLVWGGVGVVLLVSLPIGLLLPFLLPFFFVVPLLAGCMGWSLAAEERAKRQAQTLAGARLGPSATELLVIESTRESASVGSQIVLNDWGVVCVMRGQRPFEFAWSDIQRVEETVPGRLLFESGKRQFTIEPFRFFLIAEVVLDRLPDRVQLDLDPRSGKSLLLERLSHQPREWKGLRVDATGIRFASGRLAWEEIQSVTEIVDKSQEAESRKLTFLGEGRSFEVDSDQEGFGLLKSILAERIPSRIRFDSPAVTPLSRAREEFDQLEEITRAAVIVGRKSHKYGYLKSYFSHMLVLVERYGLKGRRVAEFLRNYAEIHRYEGNSAEAERLEKLEEARRG